MQITYLIFLKMADEREKAGHETKVPKKYTWTKLVKLDCDANSKTIWEIQYRQTLESLGKQGGMLGTIFRKAQNKMSEKEQSSTLPTDVKDGVGYMN